jgi:hypothetical protein
LQLPYYLLVNPARGVARKLKAKDGTLAYARSVLEKMAA